VVRLRWPEHRGRFTDRAPERVGDEQRRVIRPGETVDVDADVADHYVERGFKRVAAGGDGSGDFDPVAFTDRTPVADVAAEIRAGDADGHLDDVDAAERRGRDRVTVQDAVEQRRQTLRERAGDADG